MATAHDTYVALHAEVMAKLETIKVRLETHAMKEATDQRNWGYTGDLQFYNKLLDQILGEGSN